MLLGLFTTADAADSYWQLLLSQGLCMGLASGCLFCPAISTASTYFDRHRGLALGLVASGTVTGGLVFPAMARQLLPSAGFAWTVRAMGFVQAATLLFACVFFKSRVPPRRAGSLVDWAAFRDLEYTFYAVGMFFVFWGLYVPFYYLPAFSQTQPTPPLGYEESLNLLLILNGIGLFGRTIPNWLADRVGALSVMAPVALVGAVALLSWIAVTTPAQLYVWAAFYGIAGGGLQGLFPAALSSLTTDLRRRGTRMGMAFTIVSFAVLTGNPIAGALVTACGGRYLGAQLFTGCSLLVGTCFIAAARTARMRRSGDGWRAKV
ncbi:MFS general substrate transporter [Xylariaceae sp. FL0804]|nr:MFS general substrate transporter [Xylariaceae sp. FL0804]